MPARGRLIRDRAVSVAQKKLLDVLLIGSHLLDHRQQLSDQGQSQARLGACGNRIGLQLRLMQGLGDLGGDFGRRRMPSLSQNSRDLFYRGGASCLERGIGLPPKGGPSDKKVRVERC